jgi:hypothetical protein
MSLLLPSCFHFAGLLDRLREPLLEEERLRFLLLLRLPFLPEELDWLDDRPRFFFFFLSFFFFLDDEELRDLPTSNFKAWRMSTRA